MASTGQHVSNNAPSSLTEQEAAVATKEQGLLDRVLELIKDAAIAAIVDACANFQPTSVEGLDASGKQKFQVKLLLLVIEIHIKDDFPHKAGENTENVASGTDAIFVSKWMQKLLFIL
ncbi:hypothetical protein DITRI_Ditri18aG0084100 [Diplodiscus trichospermus]